VGGQHRQVRGRPGSLRKCGALTWHPAVPPAAVDRDGTVWLVHRAWPDPVPGDYILEIVRAAGEGAQDHGRLPGSVLSGPEMPGVRAAHFRAGRLELVPADDPQLPALRRAAAHGRIIVHRAHKRAVVRAADRYIKVYRPGHADIPADRSRRTIALLAGSGFTAPKILCAGPETVVFSQVPGRCLLELDQDPGLSDVSFTRIWAHWSRAWAALLAGGPAATELLAGLPVHGAQEEAENLRRWVGHWLRHSAGIPAAQPMHAALQSRAEAVAGALLAGEPDPFGWAHGDLHDKQIIALAGSPPGLVDFDEAARAEPALDLANLDVHLQIRLRQQLLTPGRYEAAHAQVQSAVEALGISGARFEAYAAAHRLRLGCLNAFRPCWAELATGYLAEQLRPR
jgi:hypothetical protein